MRLWPILLLVGCAPAGALRPVPGFAASDAAELGAAAVAQSPRPFVDEPWIAGAQRWGSGRISRRVELSTVVAIDGLGVAAGLALRWIAIEHDRFALGIEGQLGWLWATIAVPVSLRAFGDTRVYAAPRLGFFGSRFLLDPLAPALPIGISLGLPRSTSLRLEGQVSFPAFDPAHRRFHFGAAVARGLR